MFELDVGTDSIRRKSRSNIFCYYRLNPVKVVQPSRLFNTHTRSGDASAIQSEIVALVLEHSSSQFELTLNSLKNYKVLKRVRVFITGSSINRKVIVKSQIKANVLLLYHESMRGIELRYFCSLKHKLSINFNYHFLNECFPQYKFPVTPYDMDYVCSARFIAVSCGSFVIRIAEKDPKCVSILQDSAAQGIVDLYGRIEFNAAVKTLIMVGKFSVVLVNFDGENITKTRILSQTLDSSYRIFGWDICLNLLFFAKRAENSLEDIEVFRFSDDNNNLDLEMIIPSKVASSMSYSSQLHALIYINPETPRGREVKIYKFTKDEHIKSQSLICEGEKLTLVPDEFSNSLSIHFFFMRSMLVGIISDPLFIFRG